MKRALQQRVQRGQQWWHRRLPLSDTHTLTQRNVYLLPTRPGMMMALTLLVLLVASIQYQLNLGHLLTFLLAGSVLAGLVVCHANLRGLTLHLLPLTPVHAGQALLLDIQLANERAGTRYGVGLGLSGGSMLAWTDVPAGGSARVQISWTAPGRGRHALPTLEIQTHFPLGTFRAWSPWRPAAQVLVYPAPETPHPPLPAGTPQTGSAGTAAQQGTDGFDALRPYRRGDPLRTVVWKKAAQSFAAGRDNLISRDASSPRHLQLWLDAQNCGTPGREAQLSRLAAWVLQADRLGLDYGLRLPGREIEPDQGPAHRARCLEALALC